MHVPSLAQGVFYAATGIWPIVDLDSFERVTGPKADRWLVKTFGAVIAVIGAALIASGVERRGRPARILGLASAVVLGTADAYYAARGRISKVYLLDALAELALVAAHAKSRSRVW